MLHSQTVTGTTLELLKQLMANDIFHLLRSLVYFADAEAQRDPDPLDGQKWPEVRTKVEAVVQRYLDSKLH